MAVTDYKHGVTWRDIPTSIFAPVTADVGVPFIVGAAPTFQTGGPSYVNRPRVYLNYPAAVREMGFSKEYEKWGISAAIYTYFALFNTGPIVVNNVFDHTKAEFRGTAVTNRKAKFVRGVCPFISKALDITTLKVTTDEVDPEDREELVPGEDYIGSWQRNADDNQEYYYTLLAMPGGDIPNTDFEVLLSFIPLDASKVTKAHIIGGVDIDTGDTTGLEAIEKVFPIHTIVPGYILTPNFSSDPEVAAVCAAKADLINGCFRCITGVDLNSTTVVNPMDVKLWKDTNNYTDERQVDLWPRVGLEQEDIWLSVEYGARMQKTDFDNGNIPVETPSNKLLRMNKTLVGPYRSGHEVNFAKDYGDMLNGQGIVTAINWIGGWKCWGSNMACYPFITDPKDRWVTSRRMTDFVGNTLVLTIFQKVDKPGNRRLIDSITDSTNLWLNSLVGSGNALGARVEFRHDENPTINLIDGHYLFHVFQFFPIPAEWIEFILELDVSYLGVLF